jgi:hypothetical protein
MDLPHGGNPELPVEGPTGHGGDPEFLVLDIGGRIGALVLYADEAYLGAEIDITPSGTPRSHLIHTTVRRRRAPAQVSLAGVYPELAEGSYTVWSLDGEPLAEVTITGGRVTEHCITNGHLPPSSG